MIDAGWRVLLHELGHNLGAVHDNGAGGVMAEVGGGAGFASSAARAAVCGGSGRAVQCGAIQRKDSPPERHPQNCDEVLVATEPEVNAAAVMVFVLLLVIALVVPFVICSREF